MGVIGFNTTSPIHHIPRKLKTINPDESPGDFIAIFWGHSDFRSGGRVVYYFLRNHPDFGEELISLMTLWIGQAFPEHSNFIPKYMFVCSWLAVGYWNYHTDKVLYILLNNKFRLDQQFHFSM